MDPRIADIIEFIDNNLNQHTSLKKASQMVNLSYQYFAVMFREETGKTFLEYVREKRIAKAQSLLRDPGRENKEVYFLIGYRSQSHFCHDFKKIAALTPGAFRKLNNRKF